MSWTEVPGGASMNRSRAAMSESLESGVPSIARMRSPAMTPAFAAGPPSATPATKKPSARPPVNQSPLRSYRSGDGKPAFGVR